MDCTTVPLPLLPCTHRCAQVPQPINALQIPLACPAAADPRSALPAKDTQEKPAGTSSGGRRGAITGQKRTHSPRPSGKGGFFPAACTAAAILLHLTSQRVFTLVNLPDPAVPHTPIVLHRRDPQEARPCPLRNALTRLLQY
jgi:hypothetical protein